MDKIIELGIDDSELNGMLEQCPEIINMSNEDVDKLINILINVGCNDRKIRNIVICNPYYFSRGYADVIKLIMCLREMGIRSLDVLFDMNPFLLNKDDFEIMDYLKKRIKDGILLDDIIDEIECNPYIIDEC